MRKLGVALAAGVTTLLVAGVSAQGQLDHLLCYKMQDSFKVNPKSPTIVNMLADLQPEFTQNGCTVLKPVEFCVPASKSVTPSSANVNPNLVGQPLQNDYICYVTKCPKQVGPPAKLVTDQFGTHAQRKYQPVTVCVPAVKDPVGCALSTTGITSAAMCGGACPDPTQTCQFDRKHKKCTCGSPKTCGGKPNSAGLCGGPCQAGQVCLPALQAGTTSLICECQPPPPPVCGVDPTTGTCGGTCPNPADKCNLDPAGQCTCQPPSPLCASGPNGCGGPCPLPGQQCHPDSTGVCTCASPCGQNPLTGTCGGGCPTAGDQCIPDATGSCTCQPPANVPCSVNAEGVCGGVCPNPNQGCTTDTSGACNCQPAQPACGPGSVPNTCGGACPAGTTCQLLPSSGSVTCGCK